jgi:hypothetical protein
VLSPYFVEQCRLRLRQWTCSHAPYQRAQLVLLLHHSPTLSNPVAAAAVGLHPNSVRLWRHRWAEGDFSLADQPGRGCKPSFSPPAERALVKAVACAAVHERRLPLSRLSLTDLAALSQKDLGRPISPATVQRILDADTIKPWRYRYWIFPRDPLFLSKAEVVLGLYEGFWQGQLCRTIEKCSALNRQSPPLPASAARRSASAGSASC